MALVYTKTGWVDEDGSGNGTLYNAARMNNIENGIEAVTNAVNGMGSSTGSSDSWDGGTPDTDYTGTASIDFGGVE